MKLRFQVVVAVFGTAALVGGLAPTVLATPGSGVSTVSLRQGVLDELAVHEHTTPSDWAADLQTRGQSDYYVVDNTFAPGAFTGWHAHPGPSLLLVVSGTVTNYSSDQPSCAGQQYSAGQTFLDPGGTVHMVRNNTSSPAEVIAVQFIPRGQPRKVDEPAPPSCG